MPESATFEAIQTQELDDGSLLKDTLSVTVKGDEKLLNAEYMAVKSYTGNAQTFDMFRIVTDTTPDKSMSFTGMSLAPYELNGHIIQDLRPANHSLSYTLNRVLDGTDWRVGYIDDGLSNVTTTFYYVSAKEALKELQSLVGCEFVFKVEISGQKITDKWIEIYKEMGNRTKKRFNYGTNALTVVRETNKADIYTALIGRGKGEEVSSGEDNESGQAGYGRKITFEDIEWSIAKGDPLDKPKGQYYLELPQATQVYGIKNIEGTMSARVGVVEFDDETDKNRLINLTYQQLLVSSRPKVLFKTTVANIGATGIGDTVTIHRHDLGIHYQTRVRKIVRNKLNDNKTQIELGDAVVTASTKRAKENNATIKNLTQELEKVKDDVTTSQTSADGKNTIFYGPAEPTRKRTGDTWYRPHPSIAGETQMLVWNGNAWELVIDTSDLTSVSRAVEDAAEKADEAVEKADEAVDEINTAIQNAGFTSLDDTLKNISGIASGVKSELDIAIENAGFTSLDEMVSDTRYLGESANSNAQTAISEAQTAQENSLDALGKAGNALDGVSNLDIRVDDVEAELELKADNTFMNEDGTLTTLSNAITVNADRFSSDMQRIESRVESLSGEVNLVILSDAFEGTRLVGNESYPNPSISSQYGSSDTMREMINVEEGEQLALSKNTVDVGYNYWSYNYYDDNYNYIGRSSSSANEHILTVPSGVSKLWVSYPKGSQPQIVRGTKFVPYRPNLADQMTSDEVRIFRNEYDEFAEGTQRRITAIDGEGGRLETAETLITQTADGLSTTVGKVNSQESRISTVEQTAKGLQSTVADKASITQVTQVAEGLDVLVKSKPKNIIDNGDFSNGYTWWSFGTNIIPKKIVENRLELDLTTNSSATSGTRNRLWSYAQLQSGRKYRITFDAHTFSSGRVISVGQSGSNNIEEVVLTNDVHSYEVIFEADINASLSIFLHESGTYQIGNIVVVKTSAVSKAQISVLSDSIMQTITGEGGINAQLQTLDNTISSITDPKTGRLSIVEQTAKGLQSTVADKANKTEVTQLATGLNALVQSKPKNIIDNGDFSNGYTWWSFGTNIIPKKIVENRLELDLTTNSSATSGTRNRLWSYAQLQSGRKYRITFDAHTFSSGRVISVGQSGSNNIEEVVLTNDVHSYEVIFEADINASLSIFLHESGTYQIGNIEVVETNQISQAQISVLENNINLRVSKGDLLSQINVQAGGVLITSGTNKLNVTPETTYIEDGTIKSAMIESLEAGKIKTGTLDAGKVKVINIDAENITSNKTSFVQSAWNEATGGGVTITGAGVRAINSEGSRVTLENGVVSVGNRVGVNLGFFGDHVLNKGATGTMTITASHGTETAFISATSTDGRTYKRSMSIMSGAGEIDMFTTLDMNKNSLKDVTDIGFTGGLIKGNISGSARYMTIDAGTGTSFDIAGVTRMSITSVVNIMSGIDMRGNDIASVGKLTYNSDQRLKTNIKDTNIRALDAIRNWQLVSYDWLESGEHVEIGLIAQNSPEVMTYNEETDIYGIDAGKQTMINTLAIQQLDSKTNDEISQLKAQVASLQDELALLKGE